MLKKLITITIFTILFSNYIYSQIIIDHTTTDISSIPTNIIDSVKQNIKLQWCGQSHSHQITSGLNLLEIESPGFDVTIGEVELPQANGTFSVMEGLSMFGQCGNCCFEYIYPHEYWSGPNAYGNLVQTFVTCHPTINVSGFVWCGECEDNSSEYIEAYLDSLSDYEERYPDIRFIYATNHAQTNGALGHNRYLRNEQIRQYCIANKKILYDFGDLDCWYNGEFNYYIYDGDTVPLQHSQYAQDIVYHTTEESCKIKARATWYLMAKLAGWESENAVDTKVYLEGPFNGPDMNTNLNNSGALPLSQPYNISPWNYNGLESVNSIPNANVVDWVLVELRDVIQFGTPSAGTTVGSRAGFLLNDGTIVDLDGISPLKFSTSINDDLHIVIRHRNHLDIVAANPASLINNIYNYNFSTSANQVFGGSLGYKEIAPGVWGMISGDGNGDGEINTLDKISIWLNQTGQSGYKAADFDLGGRVDNQDKNENWLENLNKGSQVPE